MVRVDRWRPVVGIAVSTDRVRDEQHARRGVQLAAGAAGGLGGGGERGAARPLGGLPAVGLHAAQRRRSPALRRLRREYTCRSPGGRCGNRRIGPAWDNRKLRNF